MTTPLSLRTPAVVALFFLSMLAPTMGEAETEDSEASAGYEKDLDYAQVRRVEMEENSDGSRSFSVTLRHADSGWDHYADKWQVAVDETGEVLGERPLAHPHVNEQPFSRRMGFYTPKA